MSMVLQTTRLTLRQLTLADAPAMATILGDPEVMRYSVRGVLSQRATEEFIQWAIESYTLCGFGPWALVEKVGGALIGFCALNQENVDGADEVEVGYRLAPQYWGQGFATEIVRATLAYGFDNLGLRSVIAIVEPANIASVRVIQKVGFKTFVNSQYHRLGVRIYRLDRDDWSAQEAT